MRVRVHVGRRGRVRLLDHRHAVRRPSRASSARSSRDMGNQHVAPATRSPTRSARRPPASTSTTRPRADPAQGLRRRTTAPSRTAGSTTSSTAGSCCSTRATRAPATTPRSSSCGRFYDGFPTSPVCGLAAGDDRAGGRALRADADEVRGAGLGPRPVHGHARHAADLRVLHALRRAGRQPGSVAPPEPQCAPPSPSRVRRREPASGVARPSAAAEPPRRAPSPAAPAARPSSLQPSPARAS